MRFNTLLLIAFTLFFSLGYLDLSSKWWYEDDPVQYHYVMQIDHPASIFTDFDVLRGYGSGKGLTPMQLVSYWVDVRLSGANPTFAYAHNLAALVLTVLVIELMLRRWTGNRYVSTCGALTWLILPATVAVHYYISARHYMEGLLCGLLAMYCTEKYLTETKQTRAAFWLVWTVLFAASSILFKEIYAAIVPAYLLAIAIHTRSRRLAVVPVVLGLAYIGYRTLVQGTNVSYAMPFLGAYDYLRTVLALPYTVSANIGGYALVAGFALVLVKLWKSSAASSPERSVIKLALLVMAAALVATYPVAYAMLTGYKTPDPAYRMPFIVATILVMWAALALPRYLSRKQMILVGIGVLLILLPGTERTRSLWTERMVRAELEGKFYLRNPDKLLYSEEEAYWFIIGVHRLYNVAREHYINKQFRVGDIQRARILEYPIVWSYQNGSFAPDTRLSDDLRKENDINDP